MDKLGAAVIGVGIYGEVHVRNYQDNPNTELISVWSRSAERAKEIGGKYNCEYTNDLDVIANDERIQIVSVSTPDFAHTAPALKMLAAGKNLLLEKPMARTSDECERIIEAAEKSPDCIAMPAMCMRFWPGWGWLKDAIEADRFGKVLSATFRRVTSLPPGDFYRDGKANGGAILDLHIHDTDFVQYCFGLPTAVTSFGYSSITSEIDHVVTRYECGERSPLIIAEGSWSMTVGFGFEMQYQINFENATAV